MQINQSKKIGMPWYFKEGMIRPKAQKSYAFSFFKKQRLFPYWPNKYEDNDRIAEQLMFVPQNYEEIKRSGKLKKIHIVGGHDAFNVQPGRAEFLKSKCPVDTCEFVQDKQADLVIFKDKFSPLFNANHTKPPDQLYMMYFLESAMNTENTYNLSGLINWMATYR